MRSYPWLPKGPVQQPWGNTHIVRSNCLYLFLLSKVDFRNHSFDLFQRQRETEKEMYTQTHRERKLLWVIAQMPTTRAGPG